MFSFNLGVNAEVLFEIIFEEIIGVEFATCPDCVKVPAKTIVLHLTASFACCHCAQTHNET